MTRWHTLSAVALLACMIRGSRAAPAEQEPLAASRRPNIVFILSDDQDLHMDSLSYMPLLQKHLTDHGTTYERHFCTNALCCPSRVSLWTGLASHNTNVTDVNPPHGGYPKFVSQGLNSAYLPIWLQEAGYSTYYTGKLFNAQRVDNYDTPHAAGWTGSDFLLDPYTYEYLNATYQRNHDLPVSYEGRYTADVLAEKAYGFLDDGIRDVENKPFFLGIGPIAPHSNVRIHEKIDGNYSERSATQSPPVPAERHKHLFADVKVPRTLHFNPNENETNLDFNDHFYRSRLRALQSVDEIIEGVVTRLSDAGLLDNTYIFYTTDNGYHIGQHRLQPGKQCAFEEDINIPLIVRGPGVPVGLTTDLVTTHTDLAPTLMSIAGAELREDFDGSAIPLTASGLHAAAGSRQEHVNVEMWGIIMSEGKYGSVLYPNHTYKALRLSDPYEMHNLYLDDPSTPFNSNPSPNTNGIAPDIADETFPSTSGATAHHAHHNSTAPNTDATTSLKHLLARLDSLLMVLKTCKARACTHPWEVLHPLGDVRSLHHALDPRFDDFYEVRQERVRFTKCETGYIAESEGPTDVVAWTVEEDWQDLV
ncbi:hypothetical protein LTR53_009240 [Teratosphaeriaceae sp. CCFEE 6253]|nr:hypothetical protein LTR53_009240 [Teratosphaeriaceae sp. CCFEE 6253]